MANKTITFRARLRDIKIIRHFLPANKNETAAHYFERLAYLLRSITKSTLTLT